MQAVPRPRSPSVSRLALTLAVGLCLALPATGEVFDPLGDLRDEIEGSEFNYDETQDIPWIENETQVLAMPSEDNLSPLTLDRLPDGLELLVDRTRISVDPRDRVVRVWLWSRSRHGAENGTFEGYRCETREYKVYAFANPARRPPVTKAKRPRWVTIKAGPSRDYRGELLDDYFCGFRGTRSAHEIREAMTGDFRREPLF